MTKNLNDHNMKIACIYSGSPKSKEAFKIMVKPQIWVSKGVYTGKIDMNSEEDWKVLEESYEQFILGFAKTAEELNADIFCIGTELEKFVENILEKQDAPQPKYANHDNSTISL